MGFKIPKYLKNYLDSTKYRKPFENFVNNSTYYSQLNWQWMNYMQDVVRPCIAYSTASVDGNCNTLMSTSTGMAILRGASRLIAGDKHFFLGNDESCAFLSDIWSPSVNFNRFLSRAVSFMLSGGTSVLKWNSDEFGRSYLSAFRIDRTLVTTNENGDVTSAVFFIGLLSKMENDNEFTYWLTEERKYNTDGKPVAVYKVFSRSGIANSPTLPSPYQSGSSMDNLPKAVRKELRRMQVNRLNEEIPLPTHDGLGVWLMSRTAVNSCVPDAPFGDPLLYGCLDILWSIDVVFSGSIMDVMNGEGKIIVPKQFLQDTLNRLQQQYPGANYNVTTTELDEYKDESFVYVIPNGVDKDKIAPTPIQFEIRADQYGKMLEMYERLATVRAGYSRLRFSRILRPTTAQRPREKLRPRKTLRVRACGKLTILSFLFSIVHCVKFFDKRDSTPMFRYSSAITSGTKLSSMRTSAITMRRDCSRRKRRLKLSIILRLRKRKSISKKLQRTTRRVKAHRASDCSTIKITSAEGRHEVKSLRPRPAQRTGERTHRRADGYKNGNQTRRAFGRVFFDGQKVRSEYNRLRACEDSLSNSQTGRAYIAHALRG